jgi:hypothetical protein
MVLAGEYLAYASLLMPAPRKPLRLNSYFDEDARVNGQVRSLCRRLQAPRLPVAEKSRERRPPPLRVRGLCSLLPQKTDAPSKAT